MSDLNQNIKLIYPPKLDSEMTEQDWFEFRNTLDPDSMGFDDNECCPINEIQNLIQPAFQSVSGNSYTINDNLTTRNYTNASSTSRIKYIVVHYTAGNGDSAWANTNYFKSTYRGASAHYFVDEGNVIWRCVKDKDISWHCGGGLQGSKGHSFYKKCTNSNSIGIEMCSRLSNGTYYFKDKTVENTESLVRYLMNKYNVPESRVIRHYDVTGKICPAPYVKNETKWELFKNKLTINEEEIKDNKHWAQSYLDELMSKGYITDTKQWNDFENPLKKDLAIALIDKVSGGTWSSNEANTNIHWAQPNVISLCGKKIISDPSQWINSLENSISKALLLALIDKLTGGTLAPYTARFDVDHWGRNCLDSLCDKAIISTPNAWTDFEAEVDKGSAIALICKAII